MSDPEINELEALAALVESDGWQLVMAHLEKEWGATAYARRMDTVIATAKAARDSAEGDICELGAAVRAVRLFAGWPEQRAAALKAEKNKAKSGFLNRRRA